MRRGIIKLNCARQRIGKVSISLGHLSPILHDYCAIFAEVSEWQRKERHRRLQGWLRADYALPTYDALVSFLDSLKGQELVRVSYPLQCKVIFPVFDLEIFQRKNGQAMKRMLFEFEWGRFVGEYKGDYNINLLDMALEALPGDRDLLEYRWEGMLREHDYNVHEVPWGVLCGNNGASIEQTRVLLADLEYFAKLGKSLGCEHAERAAPLVEACRLYYQLWIEYLENPGTYADFASCLEAHGIDTLKCGLPYPSLKYR